MEIVLRFLTELWGLMLEMSPYLLLGFLFAGILYAWFPKEKVTRYLGKSNTRSVINAALLGVPLPLCSCGVIPTGISFYKSGASKGSTISFLISTPQTGVDSIMVTWSLLGLPFAIFRAIIALISGIFGGVLSNRFLSNEIKVDDTDSASVEIPRKIGIWGMLNYAFIEFMEDIVKWLVIGLFIAAALAVILPEDFFLSYLLKAKGLILKKLNQQLMD